MFAQENQTKSRLLAKLVWELLKTDSFDTVADVADALKFTCARLKIRWSPDDISDAFRLIETNTPLVRPRVERRLEERPVEPEMIDRKFAADFFAEIGLAPKRMPHVEVVTQAESDRRKALEMVLLQLQATIARCDGALEGSE